MRESFTTVEQNYFYRCDGEHEVISNKSCRNLYRGNTFVECQERWFFGTARQPGRRQFLHGERA